jgi:uncharacterized cupredoxin-like copper-binding protein
MAQSSIHAHLRMSAGRPLHGAARHAPDGPKVTTGRHLQRGGTWATIGLPHAHLEVPLKVRRMAPLALAALALGALAIAACSSAPPTVAPDATPSTRIEVRLTDALHIEPPILLVPAGVPVTFVVTNTGVIDHELFFGDEAAQEQHGAAVSQAGGVPFDSPNGIVVKPGQTREFTYTFQDAGPLLAGCHVPGHYQAGMKATVEVRPGG